jgi:hypothetical protein
MSVLSGKHVLVTGGLGFIGKPLPSFKLFAMRVRLPMRVLSSSDIASSSDDAAYRCIACCGHEADPDTVTLKEKALSAEFSSPLRFVSLQAVIPAMHW